MTTATTLSRLLQRNAMRSPDHAAWREKRGGIWQVQSWSEYAEMVSRLAAGLAAQGFGRDDRLAVIGDNRPRLYAALLAAQSLGGVGVPLSPDAEPAWIAQVLGDAGARTVIAEDAEQVEKIAAIKDRLPRLRLVVQTTSHGMRQAGYAWLMPFEQVVGINTGISDRSTPGDLALLLYAPGSDGEVRSVALSHAGLIAAADALMAAEQVRQTDESLAWLSMGWFADVLASQALALSVGFTCSCPENPESVWRDLREIAPTILIAPPRIWETLFSDIETRASQATGLKAALLAGFRAVAERAEQCRATNERIPALLRLKLALGEALVYAPVRDQIGLRRVRWANAGNESLSPRVLRGFRAFGINLKPGFRMPHLVPPEGEPAHA